MTGKKQSKTVKTRSEKQIVADGIVVRCAHKKLVPINELVPNPRNPNQHSKRQVEMLAKIIKRQGWRHPITVSLRSGFVVHGHCRLLSGLKLEVTKVPVDYQEYENDAQEWEDLLADNKIAELAELDDELTADLMRELGEIEADLELTGFTSLEIEKVFQKANAKAADKPEVEFSEELHESMNYIVLFFDNEVDWLQAQTVFDLKTVKALDSKDGYEKMGVGRVLNGADALNKILGGK